MNREDFLRRVRDAAAAGRQYPVHVTHDVPAGVGYVGGGDDPVEQLAAQVAAVGGQAQVVDDLPGARAALSAILDEVRPATALCWQHALLDSLGLAALLTERGIERLDHDALAALSENARRARMLAAGIGISSVSYAVAETGTLALIAGPGRERLASLLPPVHVAIVERGQIVPDLFDLFDRMGEAELASNVALITGPSKTGDIELTLTTGVHGPGAWHVIVIRDTNPR